jgi:hypothetical protein
LSDGDVFKTAIAACEAGDLPFDLALEYRQRFSVFFFGQGAPPKVPSGI